MRPFVPSFTNKVLLLMRIDGSATRPSKMMYSERAVATYGTELETP